MRADFLPLPLSMPWSAKANIMVARGEAATYAQACRLLAKRRRKSIKPATATTVIRLPYADN